MTTTNPLTIDAPSGVPFIDTTRDFDAPIGAVWRAHTDPELLGRWLGPDRLTLEEMRMDARPGGSWSFAHRSPEGDIYAFHGVIHAIDEHREVVQTFEFAGMPGHVSLERLRFEDLGGGRTRLRGHSVFQSVEDRDGMVGSGMEIGMSEGYAKLDALLAEGV